MTLGDRGAVKRRDLMLGLAAAAWSTSGRARQGCCRTVSLLAPNPGVFATLDLERDFSEYGWAPGRGYRLLLRVRQRKRGAAHARHGVAVSRTIVASMARPGRNTTGSAYPRQRAVHEIAAAFA